MEEEIENDSLTKDQPIVGIVYNPLCLKHTGETGDGEEDYDHPERPARVKSILKHLENEGLLYDCDIFEDFG